MLMASIVISYTFSAFSESLAKVSLIIDKKNKYQGLLLGRSKEGGSYLDNWKAVTGQILEA